MERAGDDGGAWRDAGRVRRHVLELSDEDDWEYDCGDGGWVGDWAGVGGERLFKRGNVVIVAGRRREALEAVCAANAGM